MADFTNGTSRHLTHTTTPVATTTTQQKSSSLASTPLKTSAGTNPATHSSTNRRIISTLQPPTSKPAEGKLTTAFESSVV